MTDGAEGRRIVEFLDASLLIIAGYVLSYIAVTEVIGPLQSALFPGLAQFASLMFLPHGVRVLATALAGAEAVPALVAGELIGNYYFWGISDPVALLAGSLSSGAVTYVTFALLRSAGFDAFYLRRFDHPPPVRNLCIAGLAASVANAVLAVVIFGHEMEAGMLARVLLAFVTGDTTGMLALIMVLQLAFKRFRRRRHTGS